MAMGNLFARLFGASPVGPLQEHMAKVRVCAERLIPFFEAVVAGDWPRAEALRAEIVALEGEADRLKRALRLKLPHSLMMAMSRRDLLDVLYRQDQIANTARDLSGLALGRRMRLPPTVDEGYLRFLRRCLDACAQAEEAVDELDELVETAFRGGEVARVAEMIRALDAVEGDTDRLQVEVRSALFAVEGTLNPVDAVFLYQVIEWTGDLADHAQKVGSRLELMLAA